MNNKEAGRLYTFDGPDGSGKTELSKSLRLVFDGSLVYCPPSWMRPPREFFNTHGTDLRLLYYAFSNWWVDKTKTQGLVKNGKYVFQDRSWLTTLSENDYFGAKPFWLNAALGLAKTSTKPAIAFLIHTDSEERARRLNERDVVNDGDLESLKIQIPLERKYVTWVGKLQWDHLLFDNTHHSLESAVDALTSIIATKNHQAI